MYRRWGTAAEQKWKVKGRIDGFVIFTIGYVGHPTKNTKTLFRGLVEQHFFQVSSLQGLYLVVYLHSYKGAALDKQKLKDHTTRHLAGCKRIHRSGRLTPMQL